MAAICAVLTWRTSHGRRRVLVALTTAPLAVIAVVSLFRFPPSLPLSWPWQHWAAGGFARFMQDVGTDSEITLNMILYVPAGFFISRYLRRPVLTVGMLVTLSVVVEALQAVSAAGNADKGDVLSNSLGAALGATLSWCVMPGVHAMKRVGVRILIAALAGVLVLGGCRGVASWHLRHEQKFLQERFSGMTRSDFDRFQHDQTPGKDVLSVGDLHSDGVRRLPNGVAEVRYPLQYLGTMQCAVATWSNGGVVVSTVRGSSCSEFWG